MVKVSVTADCALLISFDKRDCRISPVRTEVKKRKKDFVNEHRAYCASRALRADPRDYSNTVALLLTIPDNATAPIMINDRSQAADIAVREGVNQLTEGISTVYNQI